MKGIKVIWSDLFGFLVPKNAFDFVQIIIQHPSQFFNIYSMFSFFKSNLTTRHMGREVIALLLSVASPPPLLANSWGRGERERGERGREIERERELALAALFLAACFLLNVLREWERDKGRWLEGALRVPTHRRPSNIKVNFFSFLKNRSKDFFTFYFLRRFFRSKPKFLEQVAFSVVQKIGNFVRILSSKRRVS